MGRFEHRQHLRSMAQGRVEAITLARFRDAIRPGATVVDIGAYLGLFTLAAAEAVGSQGRVVAFEPEPAAFACLSASVAANGFTRRVQLLNAAAGDFTGTGTLALNPDDPSQNTTARKHPFMIEVPMYQVSDVVEVDAVSVCKIDVEGAEVAVIHGMGDGLDSICDIFAECNPAGLMAAGESPEALIRELERGGFSIEVIDDKEAKVERWPADLTGRAHVNFHAHR